MHNEPTDPGYRDAAGPVPHGRDAGRLGRAFATALGFVLLIWGIKLAEMGAGWNLTPFGVYPRDPEGLPGILWGPLIHGSVAHAFSNTAPLLVLLTALLYGYPRSAGIVIAVIYVGSGLGVWLFGREAYHLGASGLTFGLLFFVFGAGVLRRDRRAIALALLVSFLYGGMLSGLVPGKPEVSFESHVAGAVLGAILAVLLRYWDPPPPRKRYDWEDETEENREPEDGNPMVR